MSWARKDLREDILSLFAETQADQRRALTDELIRVIGCQGLRNVAAKIAWAAANREKQASYSRQWCARLTPEQRKARNARRGPHYVPYTPEQKARRNERDRARRKAMREGATA